MTLGCNISRRGFFSSTARFALASSGFFEVPGIVSAHAQENALDLNIVDTDGLAARAINQLMLTLNLYKSAGILAPTITYGSDNNDLIKSVLAGTADACMASGISPVLAAIAQGRPLRIIAGANLLDVHCIFSSKPDVQSLADLEGRRVGVGPTGALLHQLVVAAMLQKGRDPDKVIFVDVGNSAAVFHAISKGDVDAGPGEIDYLEEQDKYGVHVLTDGRLWDELPEFTNQGSYSSVEAIAEKREQLVRCLTAHVKAYRFLCSPDSLPAFTQARGSVAKDGNAGEAKSQWDFYQSRKPFALDLDISPERLRYLQALNVRMGLQREILPFEAVADLTLAREAMTRLG